MSDWKRVTDWKRSAAYDKAAAATWREICRATVDTIAKAAIRTDARVARKWKRANKYRIEWCCVQVREKEDAQ